MILHYSGELDHHAARKAMDYAESLAVLYPAECYVLDFTDLTFMDSSGLAVALNLISWEPLRRYQTYRSFPSISS